MTPENFAYWLQGLFELTDTNELTEEQVAMIKRHLATVFENRTAVPSALPPNTTVLRPFDRRIC